MTQALQDSVVLITSSDGKNKRFGTGFIIRQRTNLAYVLTCDHVLEDVGSDSVLVEDLPAVVEVRGQSEGIDLAVLRVEALLGKPVAVLGDEGHPGNEVETAGFQIFDRDHLVRPLQASLGARVGLKSQVGDRIDAWDLQISDDYSLQPGYSGSPVVDERTGSVVGVVSHRQGGKTGLAISVKMLERIWRVIDSQLLYGTLSKLGYRAQVRLFRRVLNADATAAFLIHGALDYGQDWLLNKLANQYIDNLPTSRVVRIDLSRKVRGNDVSALWRELGRRGGIKQANPDISDVIARVSQWQKTQNVLLIFHSVNRIPEESLQEIMTHFWQPLTASVAGSVAGDLTAGDLTPKTDAQASTTKRSEAKSTEARKKLLLFLIDYGDRASSWKLPFAEKIDAKWQPLTPVKSPKLSEFSNEDLMEWMEDESSHLPFGLMNNIDATVDLILQHSAEGIPELALGEICDRCGYDWYEEAEKWLKL